MNREFELIARLCKKLAPVSERVLLGIGDDAAILRPLGGKPLLTVDALVEGIHFDLKFCDPLEIGKKALAVNVSDIVAMGGRPRAALISLGVSKKVSEDVLERLYEGLSDYAMLESVDVVGGNITSNPERLMISVTLFGECLGEPLTRRGARTNDVVFLTGPIGEAAAGLELLKNQGRKIISKYPVLTAHYLTPKARTDLLEIFAKKNRVHSLIDISDGLSSELWHLAEASKVGFVIEEQKIPVSSELIKASEELHQSLRAWQLSGGEDYELLGTCSPDDWEGLRKEVENLGLTLVQIGRAVPAAQGVKLRGPSGQEIPIIPSGWNHLALSERD